MGITERKPWTAEELCRLPDGWRYEIDEGELVIMVPAGFRHARVVSAIHSILADHVRANRLGVLLVGGPGILVQRSPDILRAPDLVFYSNNRLAEIRDPEGFPEVPPDLVVEVHDPSEPDLNRKVQQYLTAGVRAVWVVDPRAMTLTWHAPGKEPRVWSNTEDAIVEPVLPAFSCRLGDLFR